MSRHLVEWLLKNPVPLPEVVNVGEDRTWRVLMSLADYATEDTGLMWASDRSQERDTGLNRRSAIQPVRQVLEQAGWLIDTGQVRQRGVKVFELVIPGYVRPIPSGSASGSAVLATDNVSIDPSGSASGSGSGSGSGSAGLAQTKQNRTSLSVSQKSESAQSNDPARAERAEVERLVIEIETLIEQRKGKEVGVAYLSHWRKDYQPIICDAIEQCPGTSAQEKARWAYAKRHGQRLPRYETPQAKAERYEEPVIEYSDTAMSEENRAKIREIAKRANPRNHTPTQVPTQERVSTDQDAYTDIHTPGGSADPQSGARDLRDITGQLMRRMAKPITPLEG